MLLALLWIFVHREHAENNVLVLDVRYLYQLLEAFPVLSGVFSVNGSLYLSVLEGLVDKLLGVVLALSGELVVELQTAIRRSVGRNLYVLEVETFLVGVDLLQHLNELLNRVVLEFALAESGLLDEELDVSLLLVLDDALISILSHACLSRLYGAAAELRCSDDAVSHLHCGNVNLLASDISVESEVEFALLHLGNILEVGLHSVVAADLVRDGLVVALHLLALECGASALYGLSVAIAEFWDDGDSGLFLHVFLREHAIDGGGHLTCCCLQWVRVNLEIVR